MKHAIPYLLIVALGASCASTPPVPAQAPIDWSAVADVGTPEIITVDPDGDERVTKIWMVVLDDQGYIRTGQSRWYDNITRNPDVVLRVEGRDYPLRAYPVPDEARQEKIVAAFREKYGFSDGFIGIFRGGGPVNIMQLRMRSAN